VPAVESGILKVAVESMAFGNVPAGPPVQRAVAVQLPVLLLLGTQVYCAEAILGAAASRVATADKRGRAARNRDTKRDITFPWA
jgi:hypothetical protein